MSIAMDGVESMIIIFVISASGNVRAAEDVTDLLERRPEQRVIKIYLALVLAEKGPGEKTGVVGGKQKEYPSADIPRDLHAQDKKYLLGPFQQVGDALNGDKAHLRDRYLDLGRDHIGQRGRGRGRTDRPDLFEHVHLVRGHLLFFVHGKPLLPFGF